jgi:iron(III) transport system substrate-binding protein
MKASSLITSSALAVVACAGWLLQPQASHAQAPTAQQWAAVEAAAKQEGRVAVYNNLNPAGAELLANAFRKDHPEINIEMTRLGSAPLIQRFGTEFAADRAIADVMITFPDERVFDGMKNGWMMAWVPPELSAYPAGVNYKNQNMLFNIQTSREAIVWNTQKVKKKDEPKEWADLLDPKWKGKVGLNPPWRSVSIQGIVAYWDKLGLGDTAAKFKANDVRFFEGSGGIMQAVIRGDVAVAEITDLPVNAAVEDGAPIGFVYPKSGTTLSQGYIFVAAKAPRPNAGKVFTNWIMTAKGQKLLQEFAGLSATRPGTPPLKHLPATASLSNTLDGLELTPPEVQKKIVDHWRSTFGVQ